MWFQNLSRLGALWGVEKEAWRRLDELLGTVERLVESGAMNAPPPLRADLERIEKARQSLGEETGS